MWIDHQRETVVLDFTGKILLDQYPELLSIDTIQSAIREIAIRTGCTVNEHAILDDAEVLLADVTKDISLTMTPDVKQELFMSCSNVKKWRTEIHKENGIEIRKAVKNKSKCKERLSLYCKATEMLRSENKMFLLSLSDEGNALEYFQGKTRVEYNLTSAYMIRRMLEISNRSLREVLESKANPLLKIFRKVFDLDTTSKTISTTEFRVFRKRNDHYMSLVLKECGDDVHKAEEILKHFYSSRTNFRNKRRDLVRVRNIRQTLTMESSVRSNQSLSQIVTELEKGDGECFN